MGLSGARRYCLLVMQGISPGLPEDIHGLGFGFGFWLLHGIGMELWNCTVFLFLYVLLACFWFLDSCRELIWGVICL